MWEEQKCNTTARATKELERNVQQTSGLFIAVLKRRSELRANNNPSNWLAVILLRLLQIKHGAAMFCAAEVLLQQLKHTKT